MTTRSKELPAPEPSTVDLWDRTNDRAILNLVPGTIQAALMEASQKEADLFGMDERDLAKELCRREKNPSPTDNRLRLSFWMEYDRAQTRQGRMEMSMVYGGVCTKTYFYGRYLTHAEKLAWLLCPPVSYMVKMEEALDFGMSRLRQILEVNPIDPQTGRVDTKLADLQAKIIFGIDQRVKGGVTQKVEQRSMNLSISTSDKQVAQAMMDNSMEALERRLKEIERRERTALNLPEQKEQNEPEVLPPE